MKLPDPSTLSPRLTLRGALYLLALDDSRERIRVADILAALDDRALAALLLVFALPNVLPMPPGTSTVLGLPLIFLAAQLAFGLRPWLPGAIARRSFSREDFHTLVRRIDPWLARAERLLRPRLIGLTRPPMEYVVGIVCLLLSVLLALPIPLSNIAPAMAISLLALGVLERDGWWVLAGLAMAVVAVAFVSGVLYALILAAVSVVA